MIHGKTRFWDDDYAPIVEEANGILWRYMGQKDKLKAKKDRGEALHPFEERQLALIKDAEAVLATPHAKRYQDSMDANKWDFTVNRGGN